MNVVVVVGVVPSVTGTHKKKLKAMVYLFQAHLLCRLKLLESIDGTISILTKLLRGRVFRVQVRNEVLSQEHHI